MKNRLSCLLVIIMVAISGWAGISARCPNGPQPESPGVNMIFIEDLAIKSAGLNNEYSFFAVGVEADSKGNIYVLNNHDYKVLRFNAKGEFLGAIGKKGQGPGEFEAPASMFIDRQDNLYVHDVVRLALAVFDDKGQFLKNIKGVEFLAWTSKFMIDPELNIVCGYQPLFASGEKNSYLIGKFDRDFQLIRKIYEKEGVITIYRIRTGEGVLSVQPPIYTPRVVWTLDQEGRIYAGYNDSYEIQILSPKGELIRSIRRDVKPEKIPEEERKKIQDDFEKRYPGVSRFIRFPQVKPTFVRLYVIEGYLFVLRERVGRDYSYDVFDKHGDYLGDIVLDFQPLVCRNGFVYTMRPEFEGEARSDNIVDVGIVRYKTVRKTGHLPAFRICSLLSHSFHSF